MSELRARLERHGQEHLLRFWDELDDSTRARLAVEVGEGATPEDLFLRDRLLQLMGIIWVVLFGVGLIRG